MSFLRPFALFALTLLAACATPEAKLPRVDLGAVDAERQAQQEAALTVARDLSARGHGLAWPILAANTALCEKTGPEIGLALADRDAFADLSGGLNRTQLRWLGYGREGRIAYVVPGGPADRAGVRASDRIVAVDGERLAAAAELADLSKALQDAVAPGQPVDLTLAAGSAPERTVRVRPQRVCTVNFSVTMTSRINASAGTTELKVTRGLLETLADQPEQIQFVIAHELAHIAQRHVRKSIRNSFASGSVVYGTVAGLVALPVDILLSLTGLGPDVPLVVRTQEWTNPWIEDFEAEADYVGLYMAARAGLEPEGLDQLFTVLATHAPRGTYDALVHPDFPDRVLAARATIAEIQAKQAAGAPLIPEGLAIKSER